MVILVPPLGEMAMPPEQQGFIWIYTLNSTSVSIRTRASIPKQ